MYHINHISAEKTIFRLTRVAFLTFLNYNICYIINKFVPIYSLKTKPIPKGIIQLIIIRKL